MHKVVITENSEEKSFETLKGMILKSVLHKRFMF